MSENLVGQTLPIIDPTNNKVVGEGTVIQDVHGGFMIDSKITDEDTLKRLGAQTQLSVGTRILDKEYGVPVGELTFEPLSDLPK